MEIVEAGWGFGGCEGGWGFGGCRFFYISGWRGLGGVRQKYPNVLYCTTYHDIYIVVSKSERQYARDTLAEAKARVKQIDHHCSTPESMHTCAPHPHVFPKPRSNDNNPRSQLSIPEKTFEVGPLEGMSGREPAPGEGAVPVPVPSTA
eukprot:COSAG01_NODE_5249_length_4385_cov_9.553663_6_plen_148_part_00